MKERVFQPIGVQNVGWDLQGGAGHIGPHTNAHGWLRISARDFARLGYAIQCVGRHDIAEELTADAFLELHRRWKGIEAERLPSWLFAVVRTRAADYWRRATLERRYLISEPPVEQQIALEPDSGLFEHEALRPVHRICLTLRYVHEMTVAEIAGFLGLTEMQIKGHLQYARGLLRKQLTRQHDE